MFEQENKLVLINSAESSEFAHLAAFNETDDFVALGVGSKVFVFDLFRSSFQQEIQDQTKLTPMIFEGHLLKITDILFINRKMNGNYDDILLISTSEDRTFIIWNVSVRTRIFQSSILSSSFLRSTSFDLQLNRLALGFDDGVIQFFELSSFKRKTSKYCNFKIAVHFIKLLKLKLPSFSTNEETSDVVVVQSWRKFKNGSLSLANTRGLGKKIVVDEDESKVIFENIRTGVISIVQALNNRLVVGCSGSIFLINTKTFETDLTIYFDAENQQNTSLKSKSLRFINVNYATSFSFSELGDDTLSFTIAESLSGRVSVYLLKEESQYNSDNTLISILKASNLEELVCKCVNKHISGWWGANISFDVLDKLASDEITNLEDLLTKKERLVSSNYIPWFVKNDIETYIMQAQSDSRTLSFFKSAKLSQEQQPKTQFAKSNTSSYLNKPITFRNTVKSSGYTQSPKFTSMFGKQKKISRLAVSGPQKKTDPQLPPFEYLDYSKISSAAKQFLEKHNGPVHCVKYNSSGKFFASASGDRTIRYQVGPLSFRSKDSTKVVKTFIGHNSAVFDLYWGFQMDGVAKLWATGRSHPLLTFTGKSRNKNVLIGQNDIGCISSAILCSKDRFIISCKKNEIRLHTYEIETLETDLIKPQLNNNTHKIVRSFTVDAIKVTVVASLNSFCSPLILTGSSDKGLQIWDTESGKILRNLKFVHSKPVHHIALPDFQHVPPTFENMFATVAIGDCIKLFDIRTVSPVLVLCSHLNKQVRISCSLSPCGKFIATGSEDNQSYFYDIRKGQVAMKLDGHSDTVSTVSFNQTQNELVTGSLDGNIRVFSDYNTT
ncbi:WD repeat-containing protein 27 [Nowakowskiella sp. JEL0078]|nr:WD repeat-containing protein 27 [Nowakowskiella sp. JEL0078]